MGLDETSSIGSLAVRLQRASVGATVEFNPLDVGTMLPSFVVLDTSEPAGARLIQAGAAQPGRWVAPTNAVEGVVYSYPDEPFPHLLSFPKFDGTDLRAYVRVYEHPDPQPAPSPAPEVMINVSLPAAYQATERFAVEVIGSWVQFPVPPPGVGSTVLTAATSYAAFSSKIPGGSVGKVTSQDVVALLRYESVVGGSKLTGQLSFNPPDQTSAPMMVSGPLVPVGAGQFQSLSATIPAAAVAGRFTAQVPAVPPPTQAWRIEAAPGHAVGLPVGIMVAEGAIASDATTIGTTYANPFSAQWRPTINYTASSQRSVTINSVSTMMSSSLQTIAEAAPSLTLDMVAGLPTMTSINAMPLNADGMTLPLNVEGAVYVDIAADRTQNTLYEVTVVEVAVAGTQITRAPVAVVSGIEPRLPLPPGVLQRGHTYYLQVMCTAGGYTAAASGNLQTFALPVSRGYQEGAVFTVAP